MTIRDAYGHVKALQPIEKRVHQCVAAMSCCKGRVRLVIACGLCPTRSWDSTIQARLGNKHHPRWGRTWCSEARDSSANTPAKSPLPTAEAFSTSCKIRPGTLTQRYRERLTKSYLPAFNPCWLLFSLISIQNTSELSAKNKEPCLLAMSNRNKLSGCYVFISLCPRATSQPTHKLHTPRPLELNYCLERWILIRCNDFPKSRNLCRLQSQTLRLWNSVTLWTRYAQDYKMLSTGWMVSSSLYPQLSGHPTLRRWLVVGSLHALPLASPPCYRAPRGCLHRPSCRFPQMETLCPYRSSE